MEDNFLFCIINYIWVILELQFLGDTRHEHYDSHQRERKRSGHYYSQL